MGVLQNRTAMVGEADGSAHGANCWGAGARYDTPLCSRRQHAAPCDVLLLSHARTSIHDRIAALLPAHDAPKRQGYPPRGASRIYHGRDNRSHRSLLLTPHQPNGTLRSTRAIPPPAAPNVADRPS